MYSTSNMYNIHYVGLTKKLIYVTHIIYRRCIPKVFSNLKSLNGMVMGNPY